jgi:hypothetical protein
LFPVAVSVTEYAVELNALNVWEGDDNVEVLLAPEAGSPKFQE